VRTILAKENAVRPTAPSANSIKSAKLRHVRVFDYYPIWRIKPSPENDKLYRPINSDDPELIALAESVKTYGVKEPLVITLDRFILSGHRRYAAAKLAGLEKIPCVVEKIHRRDPEFLLLLREYNRQRVKGFEEKLREEIVTADPEEAYQSLIKHRKAKAGVTLSSIKIVGTKMRCGISAAKEPFLRAILEVINGWRDYWPLSDRRIHYGLLNEPPLKHGKKPGSVYRNDKASYGALTELLTRARLAGIIAMEAISDETRPVCIFDVYAEPGPFICREVNDFLKGYWRDLQQSQPNHIEIVGEKNTIAGIIEPVAMKYCIPVTTGRGYCSLPPRSDMQRRFRKSGKEKLIVLFLTDFDPDGEEIAHSFVRSMRDDFDVGSIEGMKVALTGEQVRKLKLPPMMQAKSGSAHYEKFTSEHGHNVFELEAIPPEKLQELLEGTIDRIMDKQAFNAELDAEKDDAVFLAAARQRVQGALAECTATGHGEDC
jgi:hypothetical protein